MEKFTRSFISERKVSEENPRKVTFVASDSSRDSHGTVLNMAGWDLSRFNSNGIIGYQHEVYDSMNPDNVIGKGRAYVEDGKLMVEVEFEPKEINELAEKIYQKVMFGSLKAVSVGFVATGKGQWGKGAESLNGENPTYYFAGQELLEVSVVNIPSNPNALKKSIEAEMEILKADAEEETRNEELPAEETPAVEPEEPAEEPAQEETPAAEEEPQTTEEPLKEEEEAEPAETPQARTINPSERMEKNNFFVLAEESVREHRPMELRVKDASGINAEETTGAVTIDEVIEPLEKGLVIEKAGAKMQWGLEGEFIAPVVNYCESTIAGENVEVADKDIDLDAVKADPQTSSFACPVSAKALAKGSDLLRTTIINQLTQAAVRSLNDWLVKPTAIAPGIKGVFVDCENDAAGALTYAKLQALRGTVEAAGVANDGTAAYVMSAKNAAALRAIQKGNGVGMIIENDMIDGIKVITSEYVGDSVIEYGVFSYAMCGQFGPMQVLVDPYTLSKKNQTRFVLNTLFDVKPARQAAFAKMTLA